MATANMLQRTQQPKVSAGDPYDSGDEDGIVRRFNLNTTLPSQKYMADLLAICTGIGVTEEETFPMAVAEKSSLKGMIVRSAFMIYSVICGGTMEPKDASIFRQCVA